MQKQAHICCSIAAALLCAPGCASPNVNPPHAQRNTGYVDLYSPTDDNLCWDVAESEDPRGHFRTVFSDVKPVAGDWLRLAFRPGPHRLRVTFLNRVVAEPALFNCDVQLSNITPVAISLTAAGQTTVVSKETMIGGTPAGRGGRRTRVNSEETVRYEISPDVGPPFPYQPKNQIH